MTRTLILALGLLLLAPSSGQAQPVVAGISSELVRITSDFTGAELVAFGALDPATAEGSSVVVIVRGPERTGRVMRKDRVAGLWLNVDSTAVAGVPAFYFMASSRPLAEIAPKAALGTRQIGLANLQFDIPAGEPGEAELVRAAVLRIKAREDLFGEDERGVEFLAPTLFRARIPLPANTPPGNYKTEVYLLRDGVIQAAETQPLYVDKSGIERRLFEWAENRPLLYGAAAVLFAGLAGFGAAVAFRRLQTA